MLMVELLCVDLRKAGEKIDPPGKKAGYKEGVGIRAFENGIALEIKSIGEGSRQSPLLQKFPINLLTIPSEDTQFS
jgi:hypothetical protein